MSDAGESRASRSIVHSLRRIALEVLVGFVGVYAAFALSAWKDRQDRVERRHQIKRALIAEIRPMVELAKHNAPGYGEFLDRFDSTAKAGTPRPHPFIETLSVTDHVWEATKQAGGLEILDVPTFVRLSAFYNENSQMVAQYAQLRDFSIAEILPRIDGGENAFLVPGTKELPTAFGLYRTALRRLRAMNTTMAADGDSLIVLLARDTI
jgi:hypothetical protein